MGVQHKHSSYGPEIRKYFHCAAERRQLCTVSRSSQSGVVNGRSSPGNDSIYRLETETVTRMSLSVPNYTEKDRRTLDFLHKNAC